MKHITAFALALAATVFLTAPVLANEQAAAPTAESHAAKEQTPTAAKSTKPDLAAGSAKYAAVCAACHGADGNSGTPIYPKLAGQHPQYLVKQLEEFQSGKRANPVMSGFAAALSDTDMRDIAYWVSSNKAKAGFAKNKDTVTMGERIYRGGINDRQVPACAGCHSPNGAGIPKQYPRVAGQQVDYTTAQLLAFRDGGRKNGPMMMAITAKMNDAEIKAVADYMAGLR